MSTGCLGKVSDGDILSVRGQRYQMLKILTLTLIPIVVLTIVTNIGFIESVDEKAVRQSIETSVLFSMETGKVVHFAQIERGTSAMYISSNENIFMYETLKMTYEDTDEAIGLLSGWPVMSEEDPPHFRSKETYFAKIKDYRHAVLINNMTVSEIIRLYSVDNAIILGWLAKDVQFSVSRDIWRTLVAYHLLLLAKDEAGVERALGSTFYAKGMYALFAFISGKITNFS